MHIKGKEAPERRGPAKAGKQARIIVIGAGAWGINLVGTFYQLGALAGVAENNKARLKEIAGEFPGIWLFDDYRDALRSEAPGFAIATPAASHFTIARDVLKAGKDVLVEKPMTLSAAAAEELVELAAKHGGILMVGHLLLYQPAVQKMKELIDSGMIGELKSLHQTRVKLGRVRSVENVLWSFGTHDLASCI